MATTGFTTVGGPVAEAPWTLTPVVTEPPAASEARQVVATLLEQQERLIRELREDNAALQLALADIRQAAAARIEPEGPSEAVDPIYGCAVPYSALIDPLSTELRNFNRGDVLRSL